MQRQYQQHADELALHDARTQLVDSDASDSDSDDPDKPSASDVVKEMILREEAEKKRERARGGILAACRNLERDLRNEKDKHVRALEEAHKELRRGETAFLENVRRLDRDIEMAAREVVEHPQMIDEDHRVRKNRQLAELDWNERYRRTLVNFLRKELEVESEAMQRRRAREKLQIGKKASKRARKLMLPPRKWVQVFPDPVRLSAIAALRVCHEQWGGCYYRETMDKLAAEADEHNTQIRGAAIELMTFALGPGDAFQYGAHVVHGLQSQCSVLRNGATAGARALGAVPLQQAAKFTRGYQGEFGPAAQRRKYIAPGAIREVEDLKEIFKLMDLDGNGILDKREVIQAITDDNGMVVHMLRNHPTLQRLVSDERKDLWTEKVFASCDTDVSGCVDFEEFLAFVVRAMAGADPIVAGRSIDLNRHLLLRAPLPPIPPEKSFDEALEPYDPDARNQSDAAQRRAAKGILQSSGGAKGLSKGAVDAANAAVDRRRKKAKVKRMTRVRRHALGAVADAATVLQALARGVAERQAWQRAVRSAGPHASVRDLVAMERHVDKAVDELVERMVRGRDLDGDSVLSEFEIRESEVKREREREAQAWRTDIEVRRVPGGADAVQAGVDDLTEWVGGDKEAFDTCSEAATLIQAHARGMAVRSGGTGADAHLERIVDSLMAELVEEHAPPYST